MKEIKLLELFGGIGAIRKAFERVSIPHKVVDYVEIDKYAVKSYNAMFNENFETQDICEWDKSIEVDMIMHGSPCQDFSVAGLQAGGDLGSGTRSSLMYETVRIVGKLRPKYVIWENVKNVLSKKHKHNFDRYIDTLNTLGYNSYYQVLNARDYGIPQNRERVFTVSIRKDIDKGDFVFPEKQELKLRLKDMLEDKVEEKYYLSDKMIQYISSKGTENFKNPDCKINLDIARPLTTAHDKRAGTTNYLSDDLPSNCDLNRCIQVGTLDIKGQDIIKRVYSQEGLSPTLTNMQGRNRQPKIVEEKLPGAYGRDFGSKGKIQEEICDTLQAAMGCGGGNVPLIKKEMERDYAVAMRGRYNENGNTEQQIETSNREYANTITTVQKDSMVTNGLRIRKLTPKECWRLMGFDDEDFEKAEKVNSNTQLYKQARKFNCSKSFRRNI